ncbi:MAG TPA: addiction module protein [Candidatus Angelobacter sp.]|nr:addiction module protein [Candidatus Angelobacter sp.]
MNRRLTLPYNSSVTQEADDLLKKALMLPANERATLAGLLIDSLEEVDEASVQDAWHDEIAQRIKELDSGKAKTISWDEIQRRIAAKLKQASKPA